MGPEIVDAKNGSALWFVVQLLKGHKLTHPDYPQQYWYLNADGNAYIVDIETGKERISAYRNKGWELYEVEK